MALFIFVYFSLKYVCFLSDKRVENWFLMQGYAPTLIITAVYVIFVTKIGPAFMANREPFQLKWPIVIYNFVCIAINFHIFSEVSFQFTMKTITC